MTVILAMPRLTCERHGLFAGGEKLGQATKSKRRGLGYGG